MKNEKIIYSLLMLTMFPAFFYSQVGINTSTPKVTLEVVAKNATPTSVDGFIAPKIDRLRAFNMTGVPDGTLIYINDFSTGTATGQTVNITSKGYYYFEGMVWQKLNTGSSATNIYAGDGTISTVRNVTLNSNNPVNWNNNTATSSNITNISSNSLTTGNAINVSTTGNTLTTGSLINASGNNSASNTNGLIKIANTNASGAGTFATLNANNTIGSGLNILNNGNVGIGTNTPAATLSVGGNVIVGTTTGTNGGSGFSSVVRDNTTGELKVSTSSTGNTTPISYITYTLSNVFQDWVENYDTKISSANYQVVVVGTSFSTGLVVTNNAYFSKKVYVYDSGGTWHIYADYPIVTTTGTANGTWTIHCLVINNSLVKTLTGVSQNLGGNSVGAAPAAPAGL